MTQSQAYDNTPAVKTQGGALANKEQSKGPGILASDFKIPYLVVMQGLSDFVKDRKLMMGDIAKSTEPVKIGDPDKPVHVTFLSPPSSFWILEERPKAGDRFQFRKKIPRVAANEYAEWSFWMRDNEEVKPGTPGATEWRRVKLFEVFALLTQDITDFMKEVEKVEAGGVPDLNKALLPVKLSFRGTSFDAGKDLATLCTKCERFKNTHIWQFEYPLTCTLESNDQGSFYVWRLKTNEGKKVKEEHTEEVMRWVDTILNRADSLVVDEEGEAQSYANPQEKTVVSEETREELY